MKEAMKLLKEDSARIACALQEKAREATAVREKAELNLKNASSKLEAERKEVSHDCQYVQNSMYAYSYFIFSMLEQHFILIPLLDGSEAHC